MNAIDSLVSQQLEFYADRASQCDAEEQQFWIKQGLDLLNEYNSEVEGEGTFWATYWRYESESFGVTFEQEHGPIIPMVVVVTARIPVAVGSCAIPGRCQIRNASQHENNHGAHKRAWIDDLLCLDCLDHCDLRGLLFALEVVCSNFMKVSWSNPKDIEMAWVSN